MSTTRTHNQANQCSTSAPARRASSLHSSATYPVRRPAKPGGALPFHGPPGPTGYSHPGAGESAIESAPLRRGHFHSMTLLVSKAVGPIRLLQVIAEQALASLNFNWSHWVPYTTWYMGPIFLFEVVDTKALPSSILNWGGWVRGTFQTAGRRQNLRTPVPNRPNSKLIL